MQSQGKYRSSWGASQLTYGAVHYCFWDHLHINANFLLELSKSRLLCTQFLVKRAGTDAQNLLEHVQKSAIVSDFAHFRVKPNGSGKVLYFPAS